MDRFLSIEAFVRVAETQSFAETARQLGVAKSVVTARVQQLEKYVAAPLFHRTTRSVKLSDVGEAFYPECAELVSRANELVDQMRDLEASPAGLLRVHALPGFVLGYLAQPLKQFQHSYPDIVLDLIVNDAVINPVREGFDCALQIFPPSSKTLVERRLFPVRRIFCASPDYLARCGEPRHPRDLTQHRLGLYSRYPTRDRWVFHAARERVVTELKPVLRTNSVHLLRDYANEHAGIVCIPTLVASADIVAGRLKALLTEYQLSSFWLSAVYPPTHRRNVKLKLFLECLAGSVSAVPPWDQALIERGVIPARVIGD